MAQSTTAVETNGVQIKVWVSADFYDMLRGRAARNKTSVAAEARNLMNAGFAPAAMLATIKEKSEFMESFMRLHLEPLAFIAAMDAAKSVEYWKNQTLSAIHKSGEAEPQKIAAAADRTIGERATARLKRKLRELDGEGSGDDDQKA